MRASQSVRVFCYTHGSLRSTHSGLPIRSGLDSCKGCVEDRRAYTCTPAYQKRTRQRRYFLKVARLLRECGLSFADLGRAAKAATGPMARLRNRLRSRSRITVARNVRAGRE